MGAPEPQGRQAKSKSRLARYEEMAAEAENRASSTSTRSRSRPARGSAEVVQSTDLAKGFDDRVLIDDLSFDLPRAGIVGVIGPNGVGKTTLFKMIVGEEKPDDGDIRVGETVQISYVDQSRAGIDPKKNVWEVVSDGLDFIKVGKVEMPSRAYVAPSGSRARTSRSRPASCPAASATGSTSR